MNEPTQEQIKQQAESDTVTPGFVLQTKQEAHNEDLIKRIAELEKRDAENQAKLKMLYEVADKGRVFNYESSRAEKKPLRVKLSVYNGNIVIGWRTIKDELVKHPTTGRTVGENQEYELLLLSKEGVSSKVIVNGYPAFSAARYDSRIEAEVTGRKEDWNGEVTFDLSLPDGRTIPLNARFVN